MELATADLLGYLGYSILSIGIFLIGRKKISGWYFRALGDAVWICIGFSIPLTSMWIWGFVFLGMEVYGYRTWRKKLLSPNCSECGRLNVPPV